MKIATSIDTCPDNWGYYFSNQVGYRKPDNLIIRKKRKAPVCQCTPVHKHHSHCPQDPMHIYDHLTPNQIKALMMYIEQAQVDDLSIDNSIEQQDFINKIIEQYTKKPSKQPCKKVKKTCCCNPKLPIKETKADKVSVIKPVCNCHDTHMHHNHPHNYPTPTPFAPAGPTLEPFCACEEIDRDLTL